ncbi:hypothetical protein MJ561_16850 [Klebsiella pneumoniae]|nr:hypothetical protein MJ561_16850 [Klebsiella pneumoniae]
MAIGHRVHSRSGQGSAVYRRRGRWQQSWLDLAAISCMMRDLRAHFYLDIETGVLIQPAAWPATRCSSLHTSW